MSSKATTTSKANTSSKATGTSSKATGTSSKATASDHAGHDIKMYKLKNPKNRKGSYDSYLEIKVDKDVLFGLCNTKRFNNLRNKYSQKVNFIIETPDKESQDQRLTFVVKSKNYQILKAISDEILECYYHFMRTIYKIHLSQKIQQTLKES